VNGIIKRSTAEFFGTIWLVFGGCGSAVLSVNPARSTGPALLVGGTPLLQLWLFWLAPIVGAVLGAMVYGFLSKQESASTT
jgi:glycerol uptake facilitator-like aquaporin